MSKAVKQQFRASINTCTKGFLLKQGLNNSVCSLFFLSFMDFSSGCVATLTLSYRVLGESQRAAVSYNLSEHVPAACSVR